MGDRPRHRRRWLLIGVAVVVALFAGAAAFLYWPRSPTAITEQDALQDFRGEGTTPTGSVGPAAGVYSYDADGTEKISMGPLPLPTRDIPATVTDVIRPIDADCWTSDLNLMGEHTETTTWCAPADGSLILRGQDKRETVPGFQVDAVTTCDPGTVIGGTEVRCTLVMDVSGLKLTVDLAGDLDGRAGRRRRGRRHHRRHPPRRAGDGGHRRPGRTLERGVLAHRHVPAREGRARRGARRAGKLRREDHARAAEPAAPDLTRQRRTVDSCTRRRPAACGCEGDAPGRRRRPTRRWPGRSPPGRARRHPCRR